MLINYQYIYYEKISYKMTIILHILNILVYLIYGIGDFYVLWQNFADKNYCYHR